MEKLQNNYDTNEQNKIYILGGRGVGKTSFLRALFSEKFDENIKPSEKGITKSNFQKDKKVFTIKDLTDDESFTVTKFLQNELEDVILIFIIFAVNDKESFEYAKTLIEFIKRNLMNNKDLTIILLGNKYDIGENNSNEIQITKNQVLKFFSQTDNFFYNEISCKTNFGVDKIRKVIEDLDVDNGDDEDDNGVMEEEERKKRVKETDKSCFII
jgi:GTPase SAR1 family protein